MRPECSRQSAGGAVGLERRQSPAGWAAYTPIVIVDLLSRQDDSAVDDHIVVLHNATWSDYQRLLELRGDRPVPRIAYANGTLQLMTPSRYHERLKSLIGQLVEVWCLEHDIEFGTFGSWTLESKEHERGLEPDECYILGTQQDADRPDLAIEVVWTSGGIDKLPIYHALGVREVWIWRRGALTVHTRRDAGYEPTAQSELLPGIDLVELCSFLDRPTSSQAIREYRSALQARRGL